MKVICRRLTSPDGAPLPSDGKGWLRLGAEYTVLAVEVEAPLLVWIRILTDLEQVGLFRLDDFDVSDPSVSKHWSMHMTDGYVSLAISAWNETGFWERVYENDQTAVEELEAGLAALEKEAGLAALEKEAGGT